MSPSSTTVFYFFSFFFRSLAGGGREGEGRVRARGLECAKVKRVEIQLRRGGTRGALISTRRATILEIRRGMVVFKGKRIWKCLFQTGDFFSFFRYFCLALLRGRGKNFFVLTLGGIKRWKLFSFGKNLGMLVFKTSSLLSRIKTFENF